MASGYTVDYERLMRAGSKFIQLAGDLEEATQKIMRASQELGEYFDTEDYRKYAEQIDALGTDLLNFKEKVGTIGANLKKQSEKYEEIARTNAGVASGLDIAA